MIIATKRFHRGGLAISALVHVGILAVALILARAAPVAEPTLAVPPDAMQVAIVTPTEIPRYSGTPSMLRTSGTERAGQAPTAMNEPPATVPPPRPRDQRQTRHEAPPDAQERHEPRSEPPQAKQPPLPPAETAQMAMAEPAPAPSAASAETTAEAPDIAATAAFLALAGGRLGGGFAAPPIDSPFVGYDFTLPFRELVSSCGSSPGINPSEKISIVVRVFLNRDGTLAAAPQLLESNPSAKQQELMRDFASGLQKCQPYTMLPQDRYTQWKTLDLVVRPHIS